MTVRVVATFTGVKSSHQAPYGAPEALGVAPAPAPATATAPAPAGAPASVAPVDVASQVKLLRWSWLSERSSLKNLSELATAVGSVTFFSALHSDKVL